MFWDEFFLLKKVTLLNPYAVEVQQGHLQLQSKSDTQYFKYIINETIYIKQMLTG